jgi:nucleoside-diphosphate-sugar epimerase
MKIFVTGASGYIGGAVAQALIDAGHTVSGLVRSADRAEQVRAKGIEPVIGTLDDAAVLASAALAADAVVNTANADHEASALALLDALAGSGKRFVHTSGSSIVGTQAKGEPLEPIYDEDTPFEPSPGRAPRVALNKKILAYADKGVHVVIVTPSLIYGVGRGVNPDSIQVPWLIEVARKHGVAKHIGSGGNRWANVHIDDLVDLYLLALAKAPAGSFYYAENGENSMRELCVAINLMMGVDAPPQAMTIEQAAAEWGLGPSENTMGSNSRVRAKRDRAETGWAPNRPSLIEEIERGCYAG